VIETVLVFEKYQKQLNPEVARSHALSFNPDVFRQRYCAFLEQSYQAFHRQDAER